MGTKMWYGDETDCAICKRPLNSAPTFYDFRLRNGQWALACRSCFVLHRGNLGTGKGQEYDSTTREKIRG